MIRAVYMAGFGATAICVYARYAREAWARGTTGALVMAVFWIALVWPVWVVKYVAELFVPEHRS